MAHYDDLNTKRIFTVGAISVLVTVMTALAVQILYFAMVQWQAEARSAGQYTRQNEFLQDQADKISAYGVDEQTGSITIPIERAIKLVVAKHQSTKAEGVSDESSKDLEVQPVEATGSEANEAMKPTAGEQVSSQPHSESSDENGQDSNPTN